MARNLIIHGLAHRGANGAAVLTDEDYKYGHFFLTTPRVEASRPRRAQPLLIMPRSTCVVCLLDPATGHSRPKPAAVSTSCFRWK